MWIHGAISWDYRTDSRSSFANSQATLSPGYIFSRKTDPKGRLARGYLVVFQRKYNSCYYPFSLAVTRKRVTVFFFIETIHNFDSRV